MKAALVLLAILCRAEVIDRIAVSVGNQVITEVQIIDEIRVTAFLNHQKPEFTPDQKKAAGERLIEQTLMKREMELSHYPLPEMTEAEPLMKDALARREPLAEAGITEKDLQQHLWWQLTMLRFIEYRFRPSVQIPEAAIKDYYDKKRVEWEQQGVNPIPSLEDSRADIEKILTQQRVDRALDRWLGDTRTRVEILYRKEAFQ
jgi:hypothetical protein